MNWIDFNIICIGEKKPKIFENEIFSVDIMNQNYNKAVKCYIEKWDILNRIQGIWYELWSKDEKYDYFIKSTWEKPILANNEENITNAPHGYPLYIEKSDSVILGDIIKFYIHHSPIKQVIVLFRHQGYEKERIHEALTLDEFLSRFIEKSIYGNIAYIIHE